MFHFEIILIRIHIGNIFLLKGIDISLSFFLLDFVHFHNYHVPLMFWMKYIDVVFFLLTKVCTAINHISMIHSFRDF